MKILQERERERERERETYPYLAKLVHWLRILLARKRSDSVIVIFGFIKGMNSKKNR